MTQRRRLDEFLARKAAEAGAEFRDGVVRRVRRRRRGRRRRARCTRDAIVGADGVNGITARAFGLGRDHGHGVALEGNAPLDARYRGKLVLELGVVPGGYAWVFPKGDHANFGVGGWESEGPRLRDHLRRLCAEHDVDYDALTDASRLPAAVSSRRVALRPRQRAARRRRGRARRSAHRRRDVRGVRQRQARRGGDPRRRPRGYEPRVLAELARCTGASWSAKHALDRFPRLTFGIARLPFAWPVIARIVRGDLKDPTKARGALARAAQGARPPRQARGLRSSHMMTLRRSGRDRRVRCKDAGASICRHMGATEDAAARRRARAGDSRVNV